MAGVRQREKEKPLNNNDPIFKDPDYIQGQIQALTALIFALAQTMPKDVFRQYALQRLEIAKTAILPMPVSDARLAAIENFESMIKQLTE